MKEKEPAMMEERVMSWRGEWWRALTLLATLILPAVASTDVKQRAFEFSYSAEVDHIPNGARKVSIWLPYPVSDPNQEISDVKVTCRYPTSIKHDPEYGNSVLHVSLDNPKESSVAVQLGFRVLRREYVRNDFARVGGEAGGSSDGTMKRWLGPDKLVPLDGRIRKIAQEITRGKTNDLERARAIYDYVVSNMKYDKSGTGWGNGDIYWACDAKRGNCTDFHALFIGLCRASGIPAKFAIGFPHPESRGQGEIAGYHCWAEFYLKGYGWVPVDASEASKHPEKKEYFFGAHDENRVQLSIGRDIELSPPQAGAPLNYFIYPYVEVDGVPFKDLQKKFSFRDLNMPPAQKTSVG